MRGSASWLIGLENVGGLSGLPRRFTRASRLRSRLNLSWYSVPARADLPRSIMFRQPRRYSPQAAVDLHKQAVRRLLFSRTTCIASQSGFRRMTMFILSNRSTRAGQSATHRLAGLPRLSSLTICRGVGQRQRDRLLSARKRHGQRWQMATTSLLSRDQYAGQLSDSRSAFRPSGAAGSWAASHQLNLQSLSRDHGNDAVFSHSILRQIRGQTRSAVQCRQSRTSCLRSGNVPSVGLSLFCRNRSRLRSRNFPRKASSLASGIDLGGDCRSNLQRMSISQVRTTKTPASRLSSFRDCMDASAAKLFSNHQTDLARVGFRPSRRRMLLLYLATHGGGAAVQYSLPDPRFSHMLLLLCQDKSLSRARCGDSDRPQLRFQESTDLHKPIPSLPTRLFR